MPAPSRYPAAAFRVSASAPCGGRTDADVRPRGKGRRQQAPVHPLNGRGGSGDWRRSGTGRGTVAGGRGIRR
jgi:hypothetical protein